MFSRDSYEVVFPKTAPCRSILNDNEESTLLWLLWGPQSLPISWCHILTAPMVSHTSDMPQNGIGSYLSLQIEISTQTNINVNTCICICKRCFEGCFLDRPARPPYSTRRLGPSLRCLEKGPYQATNFFFFLAPLRQLIWVF